MVSADKALLEVGNTPNSRYLKVKVHPKLLTSQSKFSGNRKFTLRCQYFEIKQNEMKIKIENVSKLYFLIQIPVSEISRVDCPSHLQPSAGSVRTLMSYVIQL